MSGRGGLDWLVGNLTEKRKDRPGSTKRALPYIKPCATHPPHPAGVPDGR